MEQKNSGKKILGSVAVDSQTGVEHYQVPKSNQIKGQEVGDSGEPLRPGFQTPNYGEEGEVGESQNLAGVSEEFLHLFEHDPSEVIVYQATRHPVGVAFIFLSAVLSALLVIFSYGFLVTDSGFLDSIGVSTASASAIGGLVSMVLIALIVGIALLSAHIYRKSRLILTNQKVVFIQYNSLISRQISQLNIGEVEDVNVSQTNLLDRIFKMGRITIETAGEQNNYVLRQVARPYDFARRTIQMHEGSIAEYGN